MTGHEFRALRLSKGWTQRELARRAGVSRTSVRRWEARGEHFVDQRCRAVKLMSAALGWHYSNPLSVARVQGVLDAIRDPVLRAICNWLVGDTSRSDRRVLREISADERKRVPCGARTRKGTPCLRKSEAGRRRCRLHGGMSTGPKSSAGRMRIAEAQRNRWAKLRNAHYEIETPGAEKTHIVSVLGRNKWALEILIAAGERGYTPRGTPTARWRGYVHNLRTLGIPIETVREAESGRTTGTLAKYVLPASVKRLEKAK